MYPFINGIYLEKDELETLYIMANCGYGGICSNSSFSWWGGFLNKYSSSYFPNKLLNKNINFQSYQSWYPSNAKIIEI